MVPFIDIADRFQLAEQGWVAAVPHLREPGLLLIPVQNIGSGPALDVEVAVTPRDDSGVMSPAWGDAKHGAVVAGIGVSASVPVTVKVPKLGDVPTFDISITYSDVANKKWVTDARYMSLQKRYENLSVGSASLELE